MNKINTFKMRVKIFLNFYTFATKVMKIWEKKNANSL